MTPDIADQIIAVLHTRIDELTANHKECVRCLGEALQDTTDVAVERDEYKQRMQKLMTTVYELKTERDFLTIANKDLSEAMNRYQQLQQAAKRALEALDEAITYTYEAQ